MERLKALVGGPDLIVAPVALNPIMARLAEDAGFKAIYMSGGSLGWLKCVTEANLTLRSISAPFPHCPSFSTPAAAGAIRSTCTGPSP